MGPAHGYTPLYLAWVAPSLAIGAGVSVLGRGTSPVRHRAAAAMTLLIVGARSSRETSARLLRGVIQ